MLIHSWLALTVLLLIFLLLTGREVESLSAFALQLTSLCFVLDAESVTEMAVPNFPHFLCECCSQANCNGCKICTVAVLKSKHSAMGLVVLCLLSALLLFSCPDREFLCGKVLWPGCCTSVGCRRVKSLALCHAFFPSAKKYPMPTTVYYCTDLWLQSNLCTVWMCAIPRTEISTPLCSTWRESNRCVHDKCQQCPEV